MRRAVLVLFLLSLAPLAAIADKPQGPVDAIGMIDYRRGPHFKVGDWVQYHTHGTSAQGYKTDYTVTVLIAGEELWWGEECFWIETRTSYAGGAPELAASLLSYAVFQDTLPARHFQKYMRKYIDGYDEHGKPLQQLFLRAPTELITRGFDYVDPERTTDTVGVERVTVPKGTFDALKDMQKWHEIQNKQEGDSTLYYEKAETHTRWWSSQVPLTSLVREDQDNVQHQRTWMIGESANAPLLTLEQAAGSTELVDYGTGMKSLLIPERFQRSLAQQRAATPKPPARAPARKPAGTRS
jgi:hypothetical protein